MVADDVAQPDLAEARQCGPLRLGDVGMADVGGRIEDVGIGGGDVHVSAQRHVGRSRGDDVAQRRKPIELVAIVIGVRLAPVGNVQAVDADPAAVRADRTGLRLGEAGHA